MSTRIMRPQILQRELIARGLIPPHCRLIDVVIGPRDVPIIRYEVMVDVDQLTLFGEAFTAAAAATNETI